MMIVDDEVDALEAQQPRKKKQRVVVDNRHRVLRDCCLGYFIGLFCIGSFILLIYTALYVSGVVW